MSTEIATLLVRTPDVCGGRLRIHGTRITVNQIAVMYKRGYSADDIVNEYPHLTMAQVYAALAHYHANREEIEADLAVDEQELGIDSASSKNHDRLEAFRELQSSINLTPAKANEWQNAIREARH
ncbi:MAG TPA: DUF433 domain-containing protein [Pyrinomonadaceae bacterium]|nr:DUF433 domain-containing protein [Pyrinomonadaceae bacterium]